MNYSFKAMAVAGLLLFTANAQAQSFGKILKSAVNKAKTDSGATKSGGLANVIEGVTTALGTKTVTKESLLGTWSYEEPAVVLESDNVLSKLGGSVATSSIEDKMQEQLEKYGFKKGKVELTFKDDDTFSGKVNGKSVSGTYSVDGAHLVLKKRDMKNGVRTNVKIAGGDLQLAVQADKVLTLANAIGNVAGKSNATIGTVTSLLKNYKGMQLGMKFEKQ